MRSEKLKLILALLSEEIELSTTRQKRLMVLARQLTSGSDQHMLLYVRALLTSPTFHQRPEAFSETWIEKYIEMDFFRLFRMTKETFNRLCNMLIQEADLETVWTQGKEPIHPRKMVQIALRYYSSQETIREIGNQFNVADSTVYTIRTKCTRSLLKIMGNII
uniref:Uncharacterized protein n=2 Tax=Cacopsylla melanoneura TaxID=428564 RepID=A0A8D8QWE6_9HEMI